MLRFNSIKYRLLFLLFFSVINIIYSQSFSDEIKYYYKGDENFVESINNIKSTDTSKLAYAITIPIGLTGLSMLLDDEIRINTKKENTDIMEIAHYYGNFYYALPIAGALYFSEVIWGSNKFSDIGKTLFKSLLVGALTSISLKFTFGRSRPYRDKGNTDFNWFETENKFNSLPSGDVITAFTTSTILSNYFNNTYISAALYGLAGVTAYQRIASDNHWFSDTILSASIGIIVGNYFSNIDQNISEKSISYNVLPIATSKYSGLHFTISF